MSTINDEHEDEVADQMRPFLHGMWAAVAPGWAAHAAYCDQRGAVVTERLLDLAEVGPGDRVIELACGPGSVGLTAAERVGPTGRVVLSDVVVEMTVIAAERAAELGLVNTRVAIRDIEAIDDPDGAYDVVLCREGMMFALDPARAFGEVARVTRPGGRVALAVWGPRARNPWLSLVLDALGDELGHPVPPPGVPGPFALDDPVRLERLGRDAGLVDVAVGEVDVPMWAESFDAWWSRTTDLAGPAKSIIASLPQDAADRVRGQVRAAASGYERDGGIQVPGVCLVVSGRRPG